MSNNTVDGKRIAKKIGGAAGKDDRPKIVGMSVAEVEKEIENKSKEIFAELEQQWNLEAKGEVHRSTMKTLEDYLTVKAKDHVTYVDKGKVIKREEGQKIEHKGNEIGD